MQYTHIIRLSHRAAPVKEENWMLDLHTLKEKLHIQRPIHLVCSEEVDIPVIFGIWRPTIALPLDALTWPPENLIGIFGCNEDSKSYQGEWMQDLRQQTNQSGHRRFIVGRRISFIRRRADGGFEPPTPITNRKGRIPEFYLIMGALTIELFNSPSTINLIQQVK